MLMVLQMEDILILDGKSAFHRSVSVFFGFFFFLPWWRLICNLVTTKVVNIINTEKVSIAIEFSTLVLI